MNNRFPIMNYEESVHWLREQNEHAELVKLCYLDRDNLAAAQRFSKSEEFQAVITLLQLKERSQTSRIMDLGCGNGIASYALASLGFNVVSVDPDFSNDVGLVATARLNRHLSNGSIQTIQAAAESLPFQDNTFDIIYERQALHHFSDLHQGLTECVRVLKPGGLFFASREHVIDDSQQLDFFLSNHILHRLHRGENAYPLSYYNTFLSKAGFTSIKKIAPMDSVINHFPMSNADVHESMCNWLTSKLGVAIGGSIAQISFTEKIYRQYRSMKDKAPGRLYSFLCRK